MYRRKFLTESLKTTLAVGCLPSMLACAKQQTDQQLDPIIAAMVSEIEGVVPGLLKNNHVPGFSIALVHQGKRVWSKGFGTTSSASGKPVDADTLFECASVSKTVFSYAVMKLYEQGKLDIDKPLAAYGISFGLDDPRAAKITARHILSHQSGLQNWRSPGEPLKIHFDPGKGFMYSGEGYFYLQSLVTQLTGKTDRTNCGKFEAGFEVCATDIGDFLEQRMLKPHDMKSSTYLTRDTTKENYALPHNSQGEGFSKSPQRPLDLARYAAAGSLLTTANDYATFITKLFEPVENDVYRLNEKSLGLMFTPQVKLPTDQHIDGATSWALGWAVQERAGGNVVGHSGGQDGYRSLAMLSREKKSGFVMLTNADTGNFVIYDETLGKTLNRLLPEE